MNLINRLVWKISHLFPWIPAWSWPRQPGKTTSILRFTSIVVKLYQHNCVDVNCNNSGLDVKFMQLHCHTSWPLPCVPRPVRRCFLWAWGMDLSFWHVFWIIPFYEAWSIIWQNWELYCNVCLFGVHQMSTRWKLLRNRQLVTPNRVAFLCEIMQSWVVSTV